MSRIRRISLAATILAGGAFAASGSLAQDSSQHRLAHPHSAAPPAAHRPVPPGTYRVIRPGVGFHGAPGVAMRVHPFHAIVARHVPFARFTPAERAMWVKGRWFHRWWNGRYGWWWNAGGVWFWYGAPVYPYPTVVSDYYYEEPDTDETAPAWWYCYNPAGYYPYVPRCYGPWTPVPAQGYGQQGYEDEQSGPDQGPPPGEQYGPPPDQQYGREQGPPPSYGRGDEQGPPPGYDEPPPGGEEGPPPGTNEGPPPGDDQGPPPDDSQYPHNNH